MMKKLTKGIEESKNERARILEEKEKLLSTFKEIEQKAFTVQENYKKTQEVLLFFPFCCFDLPYSESLGKPLLYLVCNLSLLVVYS